jgi:L-alanine-DL-glutamate epimerase-like enolase superfamily enzyme
MPIITRVEVDTLEIPLRHAFATAQDTLARQVSKQVRLALHLDNGAVAFGDCVPVQYVTGETVETAAAALRSVACALVGQRVQRPREALACAERVLGPASHSARAAVETSLWDAWCLVAGVSAWSLFGGAREEAETDVTLSIVPDAHIRAAEYARSGFRRFKVKLGRADAADDLHTLRRVQQAVPEAVFRLDANQAFQADEALRFVDRALADGLVVECLEQPVAKDDLAALNAVARRSAVPVFADEAVKTPMDALRLVSETCVQGINVKRMKSGLLGALEIAAIARAAGRKLMIGCMLETRRGIGWALALAAGSGLFDFYDLDSHLLLAEESGADCPAGSQTGTLDRVTFDQDGPFLRVANR